MGLATCIRLTELVTKNGKCVSAIKMKQSMLIVLAVGGPTVHLRPIQGFCRNRLRLLQLRPGNRPLVRGCRASFENSVLHSSSKLRGTGKRVGTRPVVHA